MYCSGAILTDIDEAIRRITTGTAPMRIPADPHSDPDLVLAEARRVIVALHIAATHALEEREWTVRRSFLRKKDGDEACRQDWLALELRKALAPAYVPEPAPVARGGEGEGNSMGGGR